LRNVFVGEAFGTLQLHHQRVLNQEIGIVFSYRVTLVSNGERSFGGGPNTTEAEFSEQSALVHFFEESGAQCVGDFEHGAERFLASGIEVCVIGVHPVHLRPILLLGGKSAKRYGRR
jgi:hypothetical protein